jgi:hypothetical protein
MCVIATAFVPLFVNQNKPVRIFASMSPADPPELSQSSAHTPTQTSEAVAVLFSAYPDASIETSAPMGIFSACALRLIMRDAGCEA